MLDDSLYARRSSPLGGAKPGALPGGFKVRALAPSARFSLRVRPGPDAPAEAGGFRLDQPVNRIVAAGERWSARLGPDEWLIGGPDGEGDQIERDVSSALAGRPHSLVSVSHRNVAIEIAGRAVEAALNAGCPLDLSLAAFPAGSATRTLLGKAEIVLIRRGAEPSFQVECWRSFATYVHGFLVEAVYGLGADAA